MAEKWERLVDALARAYGWTTAAEVADRLGVTTRTIRYYAAQANAGGVIVESGPAGYRLDRAVRASRRVAPRRESSPAMRTARDIRSLIEATDGARGGNADYAIGEGTMPNGASPAAPPSSAVSMHG